MVKSNSQPIPANTFPATAKEKSPEEQMKSDREEIFFLLASTNETGGSLSQAGATILQMIWFQQMTFEEAARSFNVTLDNILRLYNDAVKALKNEIASTKDKAGMFKDLTEQNNLLRLENHSLKIKLSTVLLKSDLPPHDIANLPVEVLHMDKRGVNALKKLRINTLGQMVLWTKNDFLKLNNFGRKTLKTLEAELAKYKITLAD